MRLPFVSRRRHERALAAEQAETLRVKKVKDGWWQRHDRAAEELAAVSIVTAYLTKDVTSLRKQLAEARAQLTDGVVGEWRTQALTEKNRADALQRRLDDAMGLNTSQVKAPRNWQSTRTDGGRKQTIL